jgi:putative NADH-flavin reductase
MSRVVIFGANGRTGRLIVEEALRAGHDVTAAVRTPEKFPPVTVGTSNGQGTLAVVRADVRDPTSVQAAIAGHDAVISAIGPPGRRALGLYSEGARALVTAMKRTGVNRVLAISSAGVRHDDPHLALWYRCVARTLLKELYDDMRLMESIVRESPLDWTFVRSSHLQDKEPTGRYRVQDGETPRGGWKVTRTDLARFIIRELDEHRWSHAAPTVAQ